LKKLEKKSQKNITIIDVKINAGKVAAVRWGVKFLNRIISITP